MLVVSPSHRRRSGLTLIELVVVLFIVAVLAGLIIPITGWVRRSANYAALASNQAETGSNLEFYRTTFGNNGYPERLDSLVLNTGGSVPAYMNSELVAMLNVAALNADQAACLTLGGGAAWEVMDHDVDPSAGEQGNPGNAAIHERALADGEEVAFVDTTTGNGLDLANEIYPDGIPADVSLVAFGVGPSNAAIGQTMQTVPIDTRVDNSEVYGRFIAVFAVYSPREGRRAQLKAVLSARGRSHNSSLSEFWQSTNPE